MYANATNTDQHQPAPTPNVSAAAAKKLLIEVLQLGKKGRWIFDLHLHQVLFQPHLLAARCCHGRSCLRRLQKQCLAAVVVQSTQLHTLAVSGDIDRFQLAAGHLASFRQPKCWCSPRPLSISCWSPLSIWWSPPSISWSPFPPLAGVAGVASPLAGVAGVASACAGVTGAGASDGVAGVHAAPTGFNCASSMAAWWPCKAYCAQVRQGQQNFKPNSTVNSIVKCHGAPIHALSALTNPTCMSLSPGPKLAEHVLRSLLHCNYSTTETWWQGQTTSSDKAKSLLASTYLHPLSTIQVHRPQSFKFLYVIYTLTLYLSLSLPVIIVVELDSWIRLDDWRIKSRCWIFALGFWAAGWRTSSSLSSTSKAARTARATNASGTTVAVSQESRSHGSHTISSGQGVWP